MKTIIALLLLVSANLTFAASNTTANSSQEADKLKWLRAGYEVAKAHFPDEDMAFGKIDGICGEGNWVEFVASVDRGEDPLLVPPGYRRQLYYTDIGKDYLVYKCKGANHADKRTAGSF